jgi:Mn2+/Fe2+ NRAMP family transporter
MFDKNIILLIIFILLILFYFVIRLGAGKKKDIEDSEHLTTYLKGVRILIIILGVVGLILWLFI